MSSLYLRKRNIGKRIVEVIVLTIVVVLFLQTASAATLPIYGKNTLELAQASGGTSQSMLTNFIVKVLNYVKITLQAVAVAFIVKTGMDMIMNLANEDMIAKKKNTFIYAMGGFMMINLGDLALSIFNPVNTGGDFVDRTAFLKLIDLLINLIKFSMATVSFVLIVMTGFAIISPRSTDITKEKKHLTGIVVGLFIIVIADLIQKVFIPSGYDPALGSVASDGPTSAERGAALMMDIAGALLYVMGPIALFFMILAGFYYITSNGDAAKIGKAKNMAIGTMIAVIIAYSAYALISEVVRNALFI